MTGLQSQLSPRLTFNGNVGVGFVNSYQNGVAQAPTPTGAFQPQVGAGNGWVADAGLTYKLLKDTSISLTAAQTITPMFTGQLQRSDTFGLTLITRSIMCPTCHSQRNIPTCLQLQAHPLLKSKLPIGFFLGLGQLWISVDTRIADKSLLYISTAQ